MIELRDGACVGGLHSLVSAANAGCGRRANAISFQPTAMSFQTRRPPPNSYLLDRMRCADKCEPEAPISFAHDVDPTRTYVRKSFSRANRTAVREIHAERSDLALIASASSPFARTTRRARVARWLKSLSLAHSRRRYGGRRNVSTELASWDKYTPTISFSSPYSIISFRSSNQPFHTSSRETRTSG